MEAQYEQFIREKSYLQNVSLRTVEWYRASLVWLPSPTPNNNDLKALVIKMRESGLKVTSVNSRCRAINSFLTWSESGLKIPRLKEPQRLVPTFTSDDVQRFAKWKPKRQSQLRLQTLALTLFDTGIRIGEALGLRWPDINFDDLLITVTGKGDKQRRIPMSFELRRYLYRHQQRSPMNDLVFATRTGMALGRRETLRDFKLACRALGITVPPRAIHACRHTFATEYLRRGGSVFHLQRVLGHTSLYVTKVYSHLMTADLQAVHQRVSLLGGR